MTTARDIVVRAHRKLGIASEDVELTAYEIDIGIDALNQMMHGWKLFDIDTSHTDLTENDDFPLAAEFEEGTVYQLAERLGPDFMVPAPDADRFFRALQATYLTVAEATMPLALRRLPSQEEADL